MVQLMGAGQLRRRVLHSLTVYVSWSLQPLLLSSQRLDRYFIDTSYFCATHDLSWRLREGFLRMDRPDAHRKLAIPWLKSLSWIFLILYYIVRANID